MALFRCGTLSQGGGLSETVVWSNPSPTSNFPASGNTAPMTFNADYKISDFKYLKLIFRISTSSAEEHCIMVDADDFKTALQTSNKVVPMIAFIGSALTYGRRFFYNSDTQIDMEYCRQVSGTATARNYLIPVKVIGIK